MIIGSGDETSWPPRMGVYGASGLLIGEGVSMVEGVGAVKGDKNGGTEVPEAKDSPRTLSGETEAGAMWLAAVESVKNRVKGEPWLAWRRSSSSVSADAARRVRYRSSGVGSRCRYSKGRRRGE